MSSLSLLAIISVGVFLIPAIANAYLPAPTLSQVILSWFGVIITLGIFSFIIVVLSGFFYTLWLHWKKKPTKGTIRTFIKISIAILILIVIAFSVGWFLKSTDKDPTPTPYLDLDL